MEPGKGAMTIGDVSAELVRRVALNLGISDVEAACLPFVPVVVAATVDAEPGPRFNPSQDGSAIEVIPFDLTNARDREVILPVSIPVEEFFVDRASAAFNAEVSFGSRPPVSIGAAGATQYPSLGQSHFRFQRPNTGGVTLSHPAQAGVLIRLGFVIGRSAGRPLG